MQFFVSIAAAGLQQRSYLLHFILFILGHGVEQLLDDNLETYWQSDGLQPHLVNIQFKQKTKIKDLCIFSDFKVDESYTPQK
jgi:hypothetical protein